MKILFIASECTPIAKVGGLGDVIGSLPKALKELGCDVRVVIPKYKVIDEKKYQFQLLTSKVKVKEELVNIYQSFLPESEPRSRETSLRGMVPVYLLENEKYFGQNEIYPSSFKGIARFLFFSLATLKILSNLNWTPQIFHCHDWHTSIVSLLLKIRKFKIKTLLTLHNLSNQGKWNAKDILDFLNLKRNEIESLKVRDKDGDFNILQQGILNSDLINTVSENYSKEILTEEYGQGLENFLLKRKKDLYGILNGIDIERFNPETDSNLKINYSILDFRKKKENKIDLQKILKLPENEKIPLLGFVGRLDPQKGIDLIKEISPELMKLNRQLVILGIGRREYEKDFLEIERRYPKNISVRIGFDPVLAKKIYSGSDFFLMPSRFEPCGLGAMIAMRYGTIPIARKTGGLAEIIEDKKTGFLFKEYETSAFLNSIKKALSVYKIKDQFEKMIKSAMKKDFSWKTSAKKYLKLYKKLTPLNLGATPPQRGDRGWGG